MKRKRNITFTLRLTSAEHQQLHAYADAKDATASDVIRALIQQLPVPSHDNENATT